MKFYLLVLLDILKQVGINIFGFKSYSVNYLNS